MILRGEQQALIRFTSILAKNVRCPERVVPMVLRTIYRLLRGNSLGESAIFLQFL